MLNLDKGEYCAILAVSLSLQQVEYANECVLAVGVSRDADDLARVAVRELGDNDWEVFG